MGSVDGKVVLITGAARGQGAEHAGLLAREGARVILADLRETLVEAVARDIGGDTMHFALDVASDTGWSAMMAAIEARHRRIDALVNNAGIAEMADLMATDLAEFERTVAINQTGTFLGMRHVVPLMRARGGGSIVNISSIAGLRADPHFFAYTATKWAVRGMTRAAAKSLAGDRIRVNAIIPGIIDTPMLTDAVPGLDVNGFAAQTAPLGRAGIPADVSQMVRFLVSDESSYVTGADFTVDGGITA